MNTGAVILIVDDDDTVRDCIRQILELDGYRVLPAGDGVEALDMLASQHVDLILADIAMPRMNGYQFHERVIENPRWVTIPFVFLTARILDSDIRYGKELGVDDYLTKPFRREDLLVTVRGRLRRARQLSAAHASSVASSPSACGVLDLGDLSIDLGQHRVWVGTKEVSLSAREFRLLSCLAQEERRVVRLEELIEVTHSLCTDRTEAGSLLRPLVRSVRRKMGYPAGQMGCIHNVRGVGYQLIPPSDRAQHASNDRA